MYQHTLTNEHNNKWYTAMSLLTIVHCWSHAAVTQRGGVGGESPGFSRKNRWNNQNRDLPRKNGKTDFSKNCWFRLVSASLGEILTSPEYVFSWPVYSPLRRGWVCVLRFSARMHMVGFWMLHCCCISWYMPDMPDWTQACLVACLDPTFCLASPIYGRNYECTKEAGLMNETW